VSPRNVDQDLVVDTAQGDSGRLFAAQYVLGTIFTSALVRSRTSIP